MAAAIVLHAVSFIPISLLGFVFLAQDGLSFGRLRGLAPAAEAAEGATGPNESPAAKAANGGVA